MSEIWVPILGYEGKYEVSNEGQVKSLDRKDSRGRPLKGRILKPLSGTKGYLHVHLHQNGVSTTCKVHRLVATAFLGHSDGEVNHKDGKKDNNNVDNLEWATHSENISHSYRLGLQIPRKGSELSWAKLTEAKAKAIHDLRGVMSQREIAQKFSISQNQVIRIHNKQNWKHIHDNMEVLPARRFTEKLTEGQARQVYSLKGVMTQAEIAQRFNIGRTNVSHIHRKKLWKHIH